MISNKMFSWTQFFREAGIPLPMAKRYSLSFDDNRISRDMLVDLSKEILTEMGITAMGDIINILKHAKSIHTQDTKKREKEGIIATSVFSNKCPPTHSPHSTTSGQGAAAVSTTSSTNVIKKRVAKQLKKVEDLDGETPGVTYIAYVEPSSQELVEPLRTDQLYTAVELHHENQHSLESTEPVLRMTDDIQRSYGNAKYDAINVKKLGKMYSDSLVVYEKETLKPDSQQQGAGVIMLPGEGRDIFTTTGLHKAAKVYEAGERCEGILATDRSRRLLESAGLIPSKVKYLDHSVFSRLDYKPSVSSHTPLTPSSTSKLPGPAQSVERRRIIQLSKPTTLHSDYLGTTDMARSISSPPKKRVISVKQPTMFFSDKLTTSIGSGALPRKRVISLREAPHNTTLYSDGKDFIAPPKRRVTSDLQSLTSLGLSSLSDSAMLSSTTDHLTRTNRLVLDAYTSPRPLSERLREIERRGEKEKSTSSISRISPSSASSALYRSGRTRERLGTETFSGRMETKKTGIFGYERQGLETKKTGIFGYERQGFPGGRAESTTDLPFEFERRGRRDESRIGVLHGFERERDDEIRSALLYGYERRGYLGGSDWSKAGMLSSPSHMASTMVADEYEYQSKRHHDIRSRLERKEKEKAARRTGPLAGRLGSHKVFRRLE